MEQATLRPVPLRPAGPVDPAEALAHVRSALPELDDAAARALALIEIAGRTRDQAAAEAELAPDQLATALYVARKALRRSIFPLSASGWCERAERLLSDRIDGALVPPGPARLDVHLRNCERCVDHDRRLAQARDLLVRNFIDAHPEAAGDAGPAERPAAALRVVEPVAVEPPRYEGPTRIVAAFGGVVAEPDEGTLPVASFAGPGGQVEIRVELPSISAAPEAEPQADELPADPPLDADIPPAEPADATPSEDDAEAPEPPVEDAEAFKPVNLVWGTLTAVSVGLAVFALIITVLALSGVERLF